ncbi:MAG: hypothetical protein Ct9H90mP24_3130 [Methanobacteriota archaeon]|nr:MAG: hypothetical protein Ct9H90mP24_3130 [Euryarchaeota archaeon]
MDGRLRIGGYSPEIQEDDDFEPEEDLPEAEIAPQNEVEETEMEVKRAHYSPLGQSGSQRKPRQWPLSSMNDAEGLIVSIASSREISPSDAEIQARLEVGSPVFHRYTILFTNPES